MAKKDSNLVITNNMIALLKSGVAPWRAGWTSTASGGQSPFNLKSARGYNGFYNNMALSCKAAGRLPAFAPYSKANPARLGSKSVQILKPLNFKVEDKKTGVEKRIFRGCTTMNVFHYSDLQGIDTEALEAKYMPKTDANAPVFNPIAICDEVVAGMPNLPQIGHTGGDRAYYSPSEDCINLPKRTDFNTPSEYYSTLFHELAHSTGHFTRLDRFKANKLQFDNRNHSYGFEELVAELTACFVGSECGILKQDKLENSSAYLKSWIGELQNNTNWILEASKLATKASNYILAREAVTA